MKNKRLLCRERSDAAVEDNKIPEKDSCIIGEMLSCGIPFRELHYRIPHKRREKKLYPILILLEV